MTNEMTAEEAIIELHYILNHKVFGDAKLVGAVKMAIQALEAQPTDAVSRGDLMKLYKEWQPRLATNVYEFGQALADLPPVTTQRPKGKWIGHKEHCENLGVIPSGLGAYKWCSNCDCGIDVKEWHRNDYNYCPNCGSYNAEIKENEDD